MRRIPWWALAALCACKSSTAVSDAPVSASCELVRDDAGPPGTVPVRAEVVVNGLEVPWGVAFLPDGDLLVTERPGRLRLVRGGVLQPAPVATVDVSADEEGGLLGIALHPDFASNRLFFLYATHKNAQGKTNRVERWRLAPDGTSASFDRVILDGIEASPNHDGGRLRIGPDRMLYVGTGDARVPDNAQRPESLNGKLLRITPDGAVPPDNPIAGNPLFLLGIRNTQGFDWIDANTMVVADHGPSGEFGRSGHDEVNVTRAGENLGWPTIFGCETKQGLVTPVLSWVQAVPPGGAAIYTGDRIPAWKGSVLVGTLGSQHLHRVQLDPQDPHKLVAHEVYFAGQFGRLRDVAMGPDGQLYVTTSNCDGRGNCPREGDAVLRIVPAQ